MNTFKKIFYISTVLVILISCVYEKPVILQAAGASNWDIDIKELSHDSMSLSVSGVDKAQDVTAHIKVGADSFTRVLAFTNASQIFDLTFDKGYASGTEIL